MMYLLEPENYASARSLFEENEHHLAVLAVLGGTLSGTVYVDEPSTPRTAMLIPANQHRLYVRGSPQPSMLRDVMRLLLEQSGAPTFDFLVFYDAAQAWVPILDQVLQEQEGFPGWRQYYRMRELRSSPINPLPEHITIGRVTETMAADPALENGDLLREEILSESPSLEYFLRRNFGFAARDGHKVVGWCMAEYRYQDRRELGIGTIEAYRRQGIATHLASAVIRQAFAEGATEIGWDCWATNTPSKATALTLGFEKALDYPVYYINCRQAPS